MAGAGKKMGRPSGYTVELGERICREVASGKSLRQVLLPDDMPARGMVYRWAAQYTDFGDRLADAQRDCADHFADLAYQSAASAKDKDSAAAARVQTATYLALAKVHDPKRYGDQARFEVEHSGSVQGMGAVSINILPAQAAPVLAACAPTLDVQAEKPALPGHPDVLGASLGACSESDTKESK